MSKILRVLLTNSPPPPYFSRLRNSEEKPAISFFIPLRPSVRMEQLCSHWRDFLENSYLSIFLKTVEKIQFSFKSDKNNRYFT